MAGMLPGVESARRRRFHQTGAGFSDSIGRTTGTGTLGSTSNSTSTSTRRSSFCLYSTNFASHNNTFSHNMRSSSNTKTTTTTTTNHNHNIYNKDEELGGVAKDAKHRLDERLKAPWKSHTHIAKRNINGTTVRVRGRGDISSIKEQEEEEEEVIQLKNGPGMRKLKWGKSILGWRLPSSSSSSSSSEEECVICLEGFKMIGERSVMQIACGHRFHSRCLVPWLHANAHCPCCRMPVTSLL